MAKYEIVLRKSVRKDLDPLPKREVRRLLADIAELADDPRPPQSRKLSGSEKYRLRCGVYRVLYVKPGSDRKLSLMRQFRDNLVQVFDEPRENDFYQASWDRNHENSPKTAKTGPNQPNTAIFEGVLSHFGHFGAFLLDICQFLRFLTHFSPKMPRKVSARDGPHVDAISPPQSGQDGACPSGNLRAVFRAFGAFRSFSPPAFPHPLRIRAVRETTPARVAGP